GRRLLQRALGRHFRLCPDGPARFGQCGLFQPGSGQEQECYDGRFFEVPDKECTCHSDGHKQVYADDPDSQCLVSLDGDRRSTQDRCDYEGCIGGSRVFKSQCAEETCGDQDSADQNYVVFPAKYEPLHYITSRTRTAASHTAVPVLPWFSIPLPG